VVTVCYIFLQLADAIVTVAIARAIEIVSGIQNDVGMVTIEALDLAKPVGGCHSNKEKNNDKDSYLTHLPWIRGKLFDTSETFQGFVSIMCLQHV